MSRRVTFLAGLIGIAGLVVGGCGTTDNAAVYRLSNADDGGSVSLLVGDRLAVSLPTAAGSDFRWVVKEVDSLVLRPLGGTVVVSGTDATEEWLFVASSPGGTVLRLEYRRPTDPVSVPASGTFSVTVLVDDFTVE